MLKHLHIPLGDVCAANEIINLLKKIRGFLIYVIFYYSFLWFFPLKVFFKLYSVVVPKTKNQYIAKST